MKYAVNITMKCACGCGATAACRTVEQSGTASTGSKLRGLFRCPNGHTFIAAFARTAQGVAFERVIRRNCGK